MQHHLRGRRDKRWISYDITDADPRTFTSAGKTYTYTPDRLELILVGSDGRWSRARMAQAFRLSGPRADGERAFEVLKDRTAPQWALDLLDGEIGRKPYEEGH